MKMQMPDFRDVDLNIARGRIVLSLMAMLSLYIDPTTAGGLFHLSTFALVTLLCHLAYSAGIYFALGRSTARVNLNVTSTALDLAFATAIAFLTEGQTSPSYVFFVFAIIAAGIRSDLRATIAITLCSVTLYLLVIAVSDGVTNFYMMRAVYLAIAGYLIGFFGQQRAVFEARVRKFESKAERHLIARSLHDGYVQALAGMNLRLETCRELLMRKQPDDALAELTELQNGVAREYDAVRVYIRSLAGIDAAARASSASVSDPRLEIRASFAGRSTVGEHILQIILEGLRNARRHAMADAVTIDIKAAHDKVLITIDDDGVGFAQAEELPWAISSRVAELGGRLSVSGIDSAHLEIEMPNI
jgi:signal transduction histidine kinase